MVEDLVISAQMAGRLFDALVVAEARAEIAPEVRLEALLATEPEDDGEGRR